MLASSSFYGGYEGYYLNLKEFKNQKNISPPRWKFWIWGLEQQNALVFRDVQAQVTKKAVVRPM